MQVGGLEHGERPARDDQEHAQDRGDDAEPLDAPQPLAEIEAGDQHDDHGRGRLEDDRVPGGRVVDREVRELHRAPDARRTEHEEGAGGVRPEPADRVARRARQEQEQEARRGGATHGREKERREIDER